MMQVYPPISSTGEPLHLARQAAKPSVPGRDPDACQSIALIHLGARLGTAIRCPTTPAVVARELSDGHSWCGGRRNALAAMLAIGGQLPLWPPILALLSGGNVAVNCAVETATTQRRCYCRTE